MKLVQRVMRFYILVFLDDNRWMLGVCVLGIGYETISQPQMFGVCTVQRVKTRTLFSQNKPFAFGITCLLYFIKILSCVDVIKNKTVQRHHNSRLNMV